MQKKKKKDNRILGYLTAYEDIGKYALVIVVGVLLSYVLLKKSGDSGLGLFSNVLQVVTVLLALFTWWNTQKILANRKRNRIRIGSKDLILMVSLRADVTATTKRYFDEHKKDIENREQVEGDNLEKDKTLSKPENKYMKLRVSDDIIKGSLMIEKIAESMPIDNNRMKDYIDEFRQCIRIVMNIMEKSEKVSELHVFMSSPGELFGILTPYFSNKKTVYLYRYIRNDEKKETEYIAMGSAEEVDDNIK